MRLRKAGDEFFLTVKGGHGESRSESEIAIEREAFDRLWPATDGRRIVKHRRKVKLDDGLVAEVDSYSGDLEGLSVVEVEFETARDAVNFRPPAWFGRELTGDRAWANQSLARAGLPEKRLEYRLRLEEGAGAGVCRVIVARSGQASAAARAAGEEADPAEHVHEARKSLKKVRSALRLLRSVIDDEERKAANATSRDAGRRLSGARDAEVKLMTLEAVTGDGPAKEAASVWRHALEGEAASHRGDLTPEGMAEISKQIESVARRFRGRNPPAAGEAVAGNAGRAYRRGRKAMKQARRTGEARHFHDWRKRAKDLRYQLEILEPGLPERFTETRKRAEDLADLLGDLHDLDVLAADLETREIEAEAGSRLAKLIAEARGIQIERCLEQGKATYGLKPVKFTNLIGEALSDEA